MLFISLLVLLVLFLFIYIVNSIYLVFDHGSVISVACFFFGLRIWLIYCVFFYCFRAWLMYLVATSHFLCSEFIGSFELGSQFHIVGHVAIQTLRTLLSLNISSTKAQISIFCASCLLLCADSYFCCCKNA